MSRKKTLIVLLSVCFLLLHQNGLKAQSRMTPGKVKSVTELVIQTKGGKEMEIKKSFQTFDEQGNMLEEIEYDDDGKIKDHTMSEYNDLHQKVRETSLMPDGKIETVTIYMYDHEKNRISKTVMDKNDQIKSKKIFRYEYR